MRKPEGSPERGRYPQQSTWSLGCVPLTILPVPPHSLTFSAGTQGTQEHSLCVYLCDKEGGWAGQRHPRESQRPPGPAAFGQVQIHQHPGPAWFPSSLLMQGCFQGRQRAWEAGGRARSSVPECGGTWGPPYICPGTWAGAAITGCVCRL